MLIYKMLYEKLKNYIAENSRTVVGNAYELELLSFMATADSNGCRLNGVYAEAFGVVSIKIPTIR
jgi:hypothetical protein